MEHFLLTLSALFQSFIIFTIWKLFPEAKPHVTSFNSSQHTHRFRRRNPKSQSKLNIGRKFGNTVGEVKEATIALFILQNEDRWGNSFQEWYKSRDTNDQDLRTWQFYTFSNYNKSPCLSFLIRQASHPSELSRNINLCLCTCILLLAQLTVLPQTNTSIMFYCRQNRGGERSRCPCWFSFWSINHLVT